MVMQKEMLLDILAQNKMTCMMSFNRLTPANAGLRLNPQAASVGFIYRHIAETINLFGWFFGMPTDVQNTTMGRTDEGQVYDFDKSRLLIEQGYEKFKKYIEDTPDNAWLDPIETPFFGTVSRVRLFTHVLFHNAHHTGQIALTLSRGKSQE
jgi:uncharacterized damage-inducible protein DinB